MEKSDVTAENQKALRGAARSASYNMVLQVLIRAMSFVLNAFILRYATKELIGIVNVRLMLLRITIQFISREAFRRACLSHSSEKRWRQVINLLWTSFPVGVVFGCVFGYIWLHWLELPDPEQIPFYHAGVFSFATSAVLELLAEPLWVVGQAFLFVRVKVLAEGLSVTGGTISTMLLFICFPSLGLLAYCISAFVSALIYLGIYYGYFIYYINAKSKKDEDFPLKCFSDILPARVQAGQPLVDIELVRLTWSFFKQGFLKQLLTEGERYVMTIFDVLSFGDQGVYDIINNLGSLAARFIFLPIEESGYLFFAQTLARGTPVQKQNKDSIWLAAQVLESLLKLVVLVGSTILVFGYAYSFLLLDLYAGNLLSSGSGPTLLRWYSMYVLLIAINGTSECFVFATMSEKEVNSYNQKMLGFSIVFLFSSWYLTGLCGSVGFILANCLNMAARIGHSVHFINKYFSKSAHRPLKGLLPNSVVLLFYTLAFVITSTSEIRIGCDNLTDRLTHVLIGVISLLLVLLTIYFKEFPTIDFIKQQFIGRKKKVD